jgi:hypothetical protein
LGRDATPHWARNWPTTRPNPRTRTDKTVRQTRHILLRYDPALFFFFFFLSRSDNKERTNKREQKRRRKII